MAFVWARVRQIRGCGRCGPGTLAVATVAFKVGNLMGCSSHMLVAGPIGRPGSPTDTTS